MDTSRLRRTFKYPSLGDEDDNSDDQPSDLDEQEQETLISNLQSSDRANNALYLKAFTLLPLATIPTFLFYLIFPGSRKGGSAGIRLLCLLAVTSLLATGFVMWFVPYSDLGSDGDYGDGADDGGVGLHMARRKVRKVPFSDVEIDEDGPLGRSLPYLNVGICLLLVLAGWGLKGREDVPDGFWAFLFLPAVILAVVTVARQSMRDVEEGIGELGKMKYGYKGA